MVSDESIRALLHQLLPNFYASYVTNPTDLGTKKFFIPIDYLTFDSFEALNYMLFLEQARIHKKWETFIKICCVKMKMLSSDEMYLRYAVFAGLFLINHRKNAFSIFIGMCALMIVFNTEIYKNTGVNYCELSTDILMAIYQTALKEPFCKSGGFKGLVKFIRDFEDSVSECKKFYKSRNNFSMRRSIDSMEFYADDEDYRPETITHDDIMLNKPSQFLAIMILQYTKFAFPPLPSQDELKVRVRAAIQKNVTKSPGRNSGIDNDKRENIISKTSSKPLGIKDENLEASDVALPQCPNSSDFKTNKVIEQEEDIGWFENVVQAVIEYNSKRSVSENPVNPAHKEMFDVLNHLKYTIKLLIDNLD